MSVPTSRDVLFALNLPDLFLRNRGTPAQTRIHSLVRRYWGRYPAPEQLEAGLLALLAPIKARSQVTENLRTRCEQVVKNWIRSSDPVAVPTNA